MERDVMSINEHSIPESPRHEQRRRALLRRQRDLEELLRGERGDPTMVAWRSKQLAEMAVQLGMLELAAANLAETAVAR